MDLLSTDGLGVLWVFPGSRICLRFTRRRTGCQGGRTGGRTFL